MAKALAVHGYACTRQAALEGRSGTVYTVPLLAESEERAIILDVQADDPLPLAAIADMADVADDVGADMAVLCHTGSVEGPGGEVVLWDQATTSRIIGDALLADGLGCAPTPLPFNDAPAAPVAESVTDLLPPAFQDIASLETLGDPDEGVFDGFDALLEPAEPDLEGFDALADAPPKVIEVPHTADQLGDEGSNAAIDPAGAFAHPLLPIRITPDEGRVRLKGTIDRIDTVQMVLQPVHLFDYECDLLSEGSLRYDTVAGRVQVHGTDKHAMDVDPEAVDPQGFTRHGELGQLAGHERTLRVSDERAKERATAFLMEAHSRMVDIEVDDEENGYSYTEKKPVAPRPDHVRLHHLGVFYRAIWRFTGPSGHVDMDALTGERVDAVLANAHHDTMIID